MRSGCVSLEESEGMHVHVPALVSQECVVVVRGDRMAEQSERARTPTQREVRALAECTRAYFSSNRTQMNLRPRGPTLAFALRESACQPVLPRSLARIIKTPRYAGTSLYTVP